MNFKTTKLLLGLTLSASVSLAQSNNEADDANFAAYNNFDFTAIT